MPSKRRRVWVGFALFAALAILGLFVLDSAVAGVTLLAAMFVFIGAGHHRAARRGPRRRHA